MIYLDRLGEGELLSDSARVPAATARKLHKTKAILEVVREEAERIRREAHVQGFAAGLAQGQNQIAEILSAAHANANRHVRGLEPVLVDCVVHAVRMLIGEAGPERLIERAAMHVRDRLCDADGLVLRVSATRAGVAQEAADRLVREQDLMLPVRVVTDPLLQEDECVIESSLGRAEVRLEDQLARLREVVAKALAGVEQES